MVRTGEHVFDRGFRERGVQGPSSETPAFLAMLRGEDSIGHDFGKMLGSASDFLNKVLARAQFVRKLVVGNEDALRTAQVKLEYGSICLRKADETLDGVVEVDIFGIAYERKTGGSGDGDSFCHDSINRMTQVDKEALEN